MKIGIIGSGRLGEAIGARLASAGHLVTFASTSGDSARAVSTRVPTSSSSDLESIVAHAELVVLAVPYAGIDDALERAGDFEGRILWSCVNALKPDLSGLAIGFTSSAAEEVARRARGARVVAAIPPFAHSMASGELDYGGRTPSVFCCSDDAAARGVVADLVDELGVEPVDAGALAMSRLVEPAMMLVVALAYATSPPRTLGIALLERSPDTAPAEDHRR